MSRRAFIYIGLPASGKSTAAFELIRKNPSIKRINRDNLRSMIDGDVSFDHNREEFFRQVRDTLILTTLREGYDVVIDDTNLILQQRRKLHRLLASVGDIVVVEKAFNTPLDVCLDRNALRTGRALPDSCGLTGSANRPRQMQKKSGSGSARYRRLRRT